MLTPLAGLPSRRDSREGEVALPNIFVICLDSIWIFVFGECASCVCVCVKEEESVRQTVVLRYVARTRYDA